MKKIQASVIALSMILSAGAMPVSAASAKLPAPTGLSCTYNKDENTAEITWDPVNGAEGYVLYCLKQGDDEWTRLKSTSQCSFTADDIESGGTYYFKTAALDKQDDKFLRGEFCSSITLQTEEEKKTDTANVKMTAQQTVLADYYKNNLADGTTFAKGVKAVSSQAVIGAAGVNGAEIMLVTYEFDDGNHSVFMYGVSGGRVVSIGGAPFTYTTQKFANDIYFVKENTTGRYYLNYVYSDYANGGEIRIGKADDYGIVPSYTITSYGFLHYINDNVADEGGYINLINSFTKVEANDEITILS